MSEDCNPLELCEWYHTRTRTHAHTNSLEKVKSHPVSAVAYSASLHPERECFVAGGEDFKIYKLDFEDGKELGKQRCFPVLGCH